MGLLNQTKELCQLYDIKPARSKGQNFLINEHTYDEIVAAADLKGNDIVLEVGPGLGFLTAKLAERAEKVIAVELDDKLAEVLKTGLVSQGINNVKVENENILEISPNVFGKEKYKIVANLPYNITSVFLRKFLSEVENGPELMVLMLQKEVAERIVAKPGQMSLLSVSVQFYARPEIVSFVPKADFWPQPEVDSTIIKIISLKPPLSEEKERKFFRMVKLGFSAKRKMLKNNLAGGFHLSHEEAEQMIEKAGLNAKIRAQELSIKNWLKLFEQFI